MFQKSLANIMPSLAALHTEIFSHFSRFEYYTQSPKNWGWRMSLLTEIEFWATGNGTRSVTICSSLCYYYHSSTVIGTLVTRLGHKTWPSTQWS